MSETTRAILHEAMEQQVSRTSYVLIEPLLIDEAQIGIALYWSLLVWSLLVFTGLYWSGLVCLSGLSGLVW